MKLKEIFDHLTYGELSQLSMGGGEAGVINADNYPRVISHINLGLTALYKRFQLKEGRIGFNLIKGRQLYKLDSEEDTSFILEPGQDEFLNDILKIGRVLTDLDFDLDINNAANPYSCFTPGSNQLRLSKEVAAQELSLPDDLKTTTLTVLYQANHPVIPVRVSNPMTYEVELPVTHLEPLLLYIASRVHNPIGMTNEFNAGNNYNAKYEASCKQIEFNNLVIDQGSQNTKSERNGWF